MPPLALPEGEMPTESVENIFDMNRYQRRLLHYHYLSVQVTFRTNNLPDRKNYRRVFMTAHLYNLWSRL
jgi:hypothetical protein